MGGARWATWGSAELGTVASSRGQVQLVNWPRERMGDGGSPDKIRPPRRPRPRTRDRADQVLSTACLSATSGPKWRTNSRSTLVIPENVPGIQNVCPDSEPLSQFLEGLAEAGYTEPTFASVPLMRFGVPQGRRRFLLLASRHGPLELPPETHGPETDNPDYDTVRDWIGDLPKIDGRRYAPHDPRPPSCRPFGAQPETHPRDSGGRRQPGLAGRTPAEMPRRRHRIQRCLRPHVVGPSRFRADDPMHQLLQRSLRAPRAGSCDQRPGSGLPSDIPDGLPVRRQSQLRGPADRQRRAGEAGQGCRTPRHQAPGPSRRDLTMEATFKARARTLDMLGRQQIAGIPRTA